MNNRRPFSEISKNQKEPPMKKARQMSSSSTSSSSSNVKELKVMHCKETAEINAGRLLALIAKETPSAPTSESLGGEELDGNLRLMLYEECVDPEAVLYRLSAQTDETWVEQALDQAMHFNGQLSNPYSKGNMRRLIEMAFDALEDDEQDDDRRVLLGELVIQSIFGASDPAEKALEMVKLLVYIAKEELNNTCSPNDLIVDILGDDLLPGHPFGTILDAADEGEEGDEEEKEGEEGEEEKNDDEKKAAVEKVLTKELDMHVGHLASHLLRLGGAIDYEDYEE